jgi:hypothetical protein
MNPAATMTLDEARTELLKMQQDPDMITKSKYSPAYEYAGGQMPFVEIHLAYLRKNKLVNPSQYISNLTIMIKRR